MKSLPYYHPVTIGNVSLPGNLFLAPVAGYSDRAFRSICYENGCCFAYTEMVSAEAIVRKNEKTELLVHRASKELQYAVQIFGSEPETMAKAAAIIAKKAQPEVIDINCGCPVPKIIKTGAGSALTRNPKQLGLIVKAVKATLDEFSKKHEINPIPLTVKIRSGWDEHSLSWKEAAMTALENGVSAITLHPRTRAQGYEGKANWQILTQLVQLIDKQIPVFGSGDVFTPQDAKNMLEQTNCDAIMLARGTMGNPFLFKQTRDYLTTGTYSKTAPSEYIKTGLKELAFLIDDKGEKIACCEMRKRFCAYTKGMPGGAELRKSIVLCTTFDSYLKLFASHIEY
ncbi:MAG TPA: tRNA dihydrouridine synthase DusB [Treponemataceae bacterium]|nr:tRNA dihydrouridine synthase DusB [Treponemataceae bacterium]